METSDASLEASSPRELSRLVPLTRHGFETIERFNRMRIIGLVGSSRNLQTRHFDHASTP